jgi:hypothetical protein
VTHQAGAAPASREGDAARDDRRNGDRHEKRPEERQAADTAPTLMRLAESAPGCTRN